MLSETFFLDESAHVAAPADWGKSIVRGKTYHGEVAASLAESVLAGLLADHGSTTFVAGPVLGAPHLTASRLGQRPFQALVLNAYERRCAVTGDKIRPVLQAAHILPVAHGGENRLDNGLLLRSDVHTLFDDGYVAVDEHYRLRVSPRLRSEFGNGEEFYRLEKTVIGLPHRRADRPSQDFLEWHRDTVFLSA